MIDLRVHRAVHVACRRAAFATLALLLSGAPASAAPMTFSHAPPASIPAGRPFEIVGNLSGGEDLARARCRYRQRGGPWKQVELTLEYGDFFRAIVPAEDVLPPALEYFCIGFDYFGSQSQLFRTAGAPARVKVAAESRRADEGRPPRRPDAAGEGSGRESGAAAEGTGAARGKAERPNERAGERPPEPSAGEPPADDPRPAGEGSAEAPGGAGAPEEPAADGGAPVKAGPADEVTTLATRTLQPIAEAPAIAGGLGDEDLRTLGTRLLPEALRTQPSIETSRDVQGFHRVAVRGIRDDAGLLVMIDGHRVNSPYDGRAPLAFPTENLERLELLRGPGSALHGGGALLGVVNLVPKRREGVEASIAGGSFGTFDGHVSGGSKLGGSRWSLFGDADFSRTDGYRRVIERDAVSADMERVGLRGVDSAAGETRDGSSFYNLGAEGRFDAGALGRTKIAARFLREDRQALVGLFDVVGPSSRLEWNLLLGSVSHELPIPSGTLSGRVWADTQQVERLFEVAPAGYPLSASVNAGVPLLERIAFDTFTTGAEGALRLALGKAHQLSVGLSLGFERLPSYAYALNFHPGGAYESLRQPEGFSPNQMLPALRSRVLFGSYAQEVWRVLPDLSLTAGLRLDITRLPLVSADTSGGVAGRPEGTRLVPSLSPRLGAVYALGGGWSAKAMYGRAYRAPTLEELAQQVPDTELTQGRFEGNAGLSPASVDTLEAGLESASSVGSGKLRLRADGFLSFFSDPILAVDDTGNITPLANRSDGVRVAGVEGEARYTFGGGALTGFTYGWQRAVDLGAPDGFEVLTDVPQYRFNWLAQLPLNRWATATVLAQLGGERRNNARSVLEALRHYRIPAYALVGAQLRSAPIAERYEVALGVQNLFQQDLYDDVPRPDATRMPGLLPREGLTAMLTLRGRYSP